MFMNPNDKRLLYQIGDASVEFASPDLPASG